MTLHLRNTLTRQVEPVLPLEYVGEAEHQRIRLYSCGPTVYR